MLDLPLDLSGQICGRRVWRHFPAGSGMFRSRRSGVTGAGRLKVTLSTLKKEPPSLQKRSWSVSRHHNDGEKRFPFTLPDYLSCCVWKCTILISSMTNRGPVFLLPSVWMQGVTAAVTLLPCSASPGRRLYAKPLNQSPWRSAERSIQNDWSCREHNSCVFTSRAGLVSLGIFYGTIVREPKAAVMPSSTLHHPVKL